MYKVILCLVLMMSMASCSEIKKRFGTAEETPQLKADRSYCHGASEKAVAGSTISFIKKSDKKRNAYEACMKSKGYDRHDRPIAK